ncbi:NAD-dependent epimerase/dehydratase [Rhodofomes roseus]|uniref:NAD-dependent epimerase/dehydratase n=1 Tax=Rhodofomes roseus TaxID=34475 RepID=A0ABQ8KWV7_9APHY|nr:NAD-dependent epimerase/dehydratase [Rhodofomes roseus]KAH9843784.1 NAD-dependent epimerase/dehydratase [Rhodofomes roseus]
MPLPDGLILVTGGHGFIGGNMARHLAGSIGRRKIRIVDISRTAYLEPPADAEVLIGNLCDPAFCKTAVRGVKTVLHFAATMGGVGVIHSANDFTIYQENHRMTLNLLAAAVSAGVNLFFYASSACVYPNSLQGADNKDVSLKEDDAYAQLPPSPQGLYGLEKLNTENVLFQYTSGLSIRIARFHNVYGPGGSWVGGREKAPAAFLRKALALKRTEASTKEMEIWGSGDQRRSFCFIDDAVEAILALIQSDCEEVVNIGDDRSVTVRELADIAIRCADLNRADVQYHYVHDKPVGVASRNSNNDRVRKLLGWSPKTTLEEGMRSTGGWIAGEMDQALNHLKQSERADVLRRWTTSEKIDLQAEATTFAILLPITSRGSASPDDCLDNLARFARSLALTTKDDIARLGVRYRVRIYLAIDHDDDFLLTCGKEGNRAERVLRQEGLSQLSTIFCHHPRGHVCALWRDCARAAWKDGADYMTLMGDDVILQDASWMSAAVDAFEQLSVEHGVPLGFGCVAFMDTSFPGMPTFPVVHRMHMDIFKGEVIPDMFVNQDGDPFLFQLYRRWGCSRMMLPRVSNAVGGSEGARYHKVSAVGWTYGPLDDATTAVESWLCEHRQLVERKLTIDVVIPCYRVNLTYVHRFLALRPSSTCTVMFIIIVDDPCSPNIAALMGRYAHRPDIRIRVNAQNMGASAARNRGLQESSAEWVLFLDDDVTPEDNILIETEKVIRTNPSAAGFVGTALFPVADTVATAAVHLAGVTYFWDIARKRADDNDLPWGVTACLVARRHMEDNIVFDLGFPKTGGGEDIDYCRRKRDFSFAHGGVGFCAAPDVVVTHPWWKQGRRSWWRFYMWSKGDGALVAKYPKFTYRQAAPNSAESLVLCAVLTVGACTISLLTSGATSTVLRIAFLGTRACLSLLAANIAHDLYRHGWRNADRTAALHMALGGWQLVVAMIESTFIRIFSEYGRLVGMLERGEYGVIGMSFDWFTNRAGDGPRREENKNRLQRVALWILILAIWCGM